jgi:glutathione S-transferase
MFTLYSMQRSGNCYKVRLALAQLNLAYRLVEIDILKGDTRTPDFLAKNPSGHVPLLEAAPGRFLPESGAILWYLALGTPLAPEDRLDRAETLQWMFFEQHSLEPYVGAAHFWLALVKGGRELQMHAIEEWMEHGYQAMHVMEQHLESHRFTASSPPAATPSRTSRSTPTRTSPTSAASISPAFQRSAAGSSASPSNPAMCAWIGIRPRWRLRSDATVIARLDPAIHRNSIAFCEADGYAGQARV